MLCFYSYDISDILMLRVVNLRLGKLGRVKIFKWTGPGLAVTARISGEMGRAVTARGFRRTGPGL